MTAYTYKGLRGLRKENYQKNGFIGYLVFFFGLLIVCGVIALNLIFPLLFYILVPFVVLPVFFACQAVIYLLRDASSLTLGGFFKCFFGYFGEHFRSTFGALKSFLFSLIFYGAMTITTSLVTFLCFYFTNFQGFGDLVNSVNVLQFTSVEDINNFIDQYYVAITYFGLCTSLPTMTVFTFVFIYLCSKNSVALYYRLSNYKLTGRAISKIHSMVVSKNRKLYLRYYWSLNWPLFVLLIGGFALGSYVGYLYELNATSLYTFGLMISLFIAYFIYGPTYVANKEAIYIALKEEYDQQATELLTSLTNSMEDLLSKFQTFNQEQNKDDEDNNEPK